MQQRHFFPLLTSHLNQLIRGWLKDDFSLLQLGSCFYSLAIELITESWQHGDTVISNSKGERSMGIQVVRGLNVQVR